MIILFILIIGVQYSCLARKITKGPYLADPKKTSMIIRWESDFSTEWKVDFSSDTSLSRTQKAILLGEKEGFYLYEAQIKDLKPDTKYFYQVLCKDKKSTLHHFTTNPREYTPFSFVAMGDSRSNHHIFKAIIDEVKNKSPGLIISMGDLVENGGKFKQWRTHYFNVASNIIDHIPLISTLGDHEGDGDNGKLFRYFLYPYMEIDKLWFSFDFGKAHFVSLDYRHPDNENMIKWFKDDLAKTDAKWIFVYTHRPSYNFGGHRSSWGKEKWSELFRKFKVDIVFSGHSHQYERFFPMRPRSKIDSWPVTYITTGGAGADLYEVIEHPYLAQSKSIHHFIFIKIANDTLHFTAYDTVGAILDKFTIIKHKGRYNSEYLNLVIPQGHVDLVRIFTRAISPDLNNIPLFSKPSILTLEMKSPSLIDEDINFEIAISEESAKHYRMVPINVKGILKKGESLEIPIKIFTNGEMRISEWGEIEPALRLEIKYKTSLREEKIISSKIDYWPDVD